MRLYIRTTNQVSITVIGTSEGVELSAWKASVASGYACHACQADIFPRFEKNVAACKCVKKCQCLQLLRPDAADYLVYLNVSVVLTCTKGNLELFQTNLQEFGNCYDHHVSIHSADHYFRVSLLSHVLNMDEDPRVCFLMGAGSKR